MPDMRPLKPGVLMLRRWFSSFFDPVSIFRSFAAFPGYVAAWRRYARVPGAEQIRLLDAYPCLHDRTRHSGIDSHYFYANGWTMRRIIAQGSPYHVDVGSQTIFANLLAATVPVVFVDYRPLQASLSGLTCIGSDILALPFRDASIHSLSCLHVAEHIGLGRYGDNLNPSGTRLACAELARVLAPGGNLYFALPVGHPRVYFNAHRVHTPDTILEYFAKLHLEEFSGVHDDGHFVERAELTEFLDSDYACGFFWFRRPLRDEVMNNE